MRQRIRRVPFLAPAPFDLEVMTLADLRAMAAPGFLAAPQRPEFHLLLLVTAGATTVTVDFRPCPLTPERALWVRPGQVLVFGEDDGPSGDLVLFRPDVLIPGTRAAAIADDRFAPVVVDHPPDGRAAVDRARRALRREYRAAARDGHATATRAELLVHLLSVLVLTLGDHAPEAVRDGPDDLYARFRELLERDFATAHDVGHYADALNYSSRTLARVTQAAIGRTPKQAIKDRLVLEARRLLAHTELPVSAIAAQLGFADPSNFSAFFTHEARDTPTAFRHRQRAM
jgi:AraC-like DNA-binding protein